MTYGVKEALLCCLSFVDLFIEFLSDIKCVQMLFYAWAVVECVLFMALLLTTKLSNFSFLLF